MKIIYSINVIRVYDKVSIYFLRENNNRKNRRHHYKHYIFPASENDIEKIMALLNKRVEKYNCVVFLNYTTFGFSIVREKGL